MVVEGDVLNDFLRFVGILIAEFAGGSAVNLVLEMKGDMIIKNLDLKPTIDVMMRDFLEGLNGLEKVYKMTPHQNSSGSSFWNLNASSPSSTPMIVEGKVTLVYDEGQPLEKVSSSCEYDSEDEVASVDNEMANYYF
ncbi:hypothetical protein Tco_1084491 [Tanacetum coccineum]